VPKHNKVPAKKPTGKRVPTQAIESGYKSESERVAGPHVEPLYDPPPPPASSTPKPSAKLTGKSSSVIPTKAKHSSPPAKKSGTSSLVIHKQSVLNACNCTDASHNRVEFNVPQSDTSQVMHILAVKFSLCNYPCECCAEFGEVIINKLLKPYILDPAG